MDLRDQIDVYLNSAWKREIEETPYTGHQLVKFGEWTRKSGFVKKDEARYAQGTIDITIPCPVIAIIDEKIRKESLVLTITGTNAEYVEDEQFKQIGKTITKKVYGAGTTTETTTLNIPRFTRPTGTFLLSGLGNKIYEITNVTANVTLSQYGGGKVSFYGLASEGSKVLYYLAMVNLHNTMKQIINGIWLAPPKCPICNGNKTINGATCPECLGYGYMGENAERGIALDKGYDVRISRDKFSEYPITDAQWEKVWKFINESWTQKWWVTPTISQIKRMFAHFYGVNNDEIIITERYHFSMPHWNISLPLEGSISSPFTQVDLPLMKFIAESVTPAGVNVFVGFYTFPYWGNFDDLVCITPYVISSDSQIISRKILYSSIEADYDNWFSRWRTWNGWCECVDNFEGDLSKWNTNGTVDIYNVNDIGRNWCRLHDASYIQTKTGYAIDQPTGVVELWIHPLQTNMRFGGYLTGIEDWAFYVDFKNNGFYDHNNNLIRSANFDNDFHVRIDFVTDQILTGTVGYINEIQINKDLVASGIAFLNGLAPGRPIRIQSFGTGYGFVDNFGGNWVPSYIAGDNWPRLYPWGWGQYHVDCLGGITGLYEKFFRLNKFFNASGVCS